ncbi:right-handed parallel beta-helix repeat-containing protein [Sphingobacterium sp. SYP-B4668]|uniref:right-handed parallel beta-helix repeat-containing protein n=1 Tax=Sphingobacterium sp. SYP-B4668 TaxID=2996035 RepID=UPI0022DDD42B|nr:right-handed parallel beta-helix repeat-containing protein [Sphingobacterium sp. SYP-B4668]
MLMISRKFKILPFILILFIGTVSAQKDRQFFVSPTGNDKALGTLDKPFATLERARTAVKKVLQTKKGGAINVYFRGGEYYFKSSVFFDEHDSGSEVAPVTYAAYQDETVSFSGGISLPIHSAVPVKDKAILARFTASAKNQILQINLKKAGITDYGQLTPRGFLRPYEPAPLELFVNKEALSISRFPNDTLMQMGKVLDPGSVPRNEDFSQRGGKFHFLNDQPSRWTQAKDIWISGFFHYGYADDAVQVANIDLNNKVITTKQETLYGFKSGAKFNKFFAYNLMEEIDRPGEYYLDRSSGILYFYPLSTDLKTIEVSMLEAPLVQLKGASYIHFDKLIFECSRGMGLYIENGEANRIESCIFRNLGIVAVTMGKGVEPFKQLVHEGDGVVASAQLGGLTSHIYKNTTFNREAGTNHIISNCEIYNIGSGGISMGGGDRLTLEKGNNQVVNCTIHDFNRLNRSYRAGINIDGVGNIIRNNEIYNCPGSAVLLHGNDHLIEYNAIHHAVTDGDDMGAIYYGRDPSEQGNIVRYNFFHHIGNDHGLIVAVYHDDGACGMEVTGNVFYKAGTKNILLGGGSDNVYRNNIFIGPRQALHLDNRLMNWAKANLDKDGLFQKRLEAVNYKGEPWASRYPHLSTYFEDDPALPKRNWIDHNVFIDTKLLHAGKADWSWIGRNYIGTGDPGFEDISEMNFQLKPTSDIFKLLPEFKAIPFDKIGVQR